MSLHMNKNFRITVPLQLWPAAKKLGTSFIDIEFESLLLYREVCLLVQHQLSSLLSSFPIGVRTTYLGKLFNANKYHSKA